MIWKIRSGISVLQASDAVFNPDMKTRLGAIVVEISRDLESDTF